MQLPDPTRTTLFLDFDGVICNSIDECYVSSWLAYHGLSKHAWPTAARPGAVTSEEATGKDIARSRLPDSVALADHERFARYRPLIRRGGDYLLLQYCVDHGVELETQQDLDSMSADLADEGSDVIHAQFYRAREQLLRDDPDYWLRLNTLYPEVAAHLPRLAERHWIITTKEASFAQRILAYHRVDWSLDRIICSGKSRKFTVISQMLEALPNRRAILVDDQIDHLREQDDPDVYGVLAAWGFVMPEWLEETQVPILERNGIDQYLRRFL
jgi:hypothetical protein